MHDSSIIFTLENIFRRLRSIYEEKTKMRERLKITLIIMIDVSSFELITILNHCNLNLLYFLHITVQQCNHMHIC